MIRTLIFCQLFSTSPMAHIFTSMFLVSLIISLSAYFLALSELFPTNFKSIIITPIGNISHIVTLSTLDHQGRPKGSKTSRDSVGI